MRIRKLQHTIVTSAICLSGAMWAHSGIAGPIPSPVVRMEQVATPLDAFQYGEQANGDAHSVFNRSPCGQIASDDGRWVVFSSIASNLVRGDTNNVEDVFLRDTQLGTTRRISVTSSGEQLVHPSVDACMSASGRYVVYRTMSDVTGESHHEDEDIYLYDRVENSQLLVSRPVTGCGAECDGLNLSPNISADGRFVAFTSTSAELIAGADAQGTTQLYLFERLTRNMSMITAMPGSLVGFGGGGASLSEDGRFITLATTTDSLGTSNGQTDVYVFDRVLEVFRLVSKANDGTEGNGDSYGGVISRDGSHAAFLSAADNLVPSDNNGTELDVFVVQLGLDIIELATVSDNGNQPEGHVTAWPSISADGMEVAFMSEGGGLIDLAGTITRGVYVRDRVANTTERIAPQSLDQFDDRAETPYLSPDGDTLYYTAGAADLVIDDTNGALDLFKTQIDNGVTERLSMPTAGYVGPSGPNEEIFARDRRRTVTADGRFVVFTSYATNLTSSGGPIERASSLPEVYLHDRLTRGVTLISRPAGSPSNPDGFSSTPSISSDGRFVAFHSAHDDLVPNDDNGVLDVFVYDRQTQSISRITTDQPGVRVGGFEAYMAADGEHVAFLSDITGLGASFQAYVADLTMGTIERVSVNNSGDPANSAAAGVSVSGDGRYAVFESFADNLVAGDTNSKTDIFLHDRQNGITRRISVSTTGDEGDDASYDAQISDDGSTVVFTSDADTFLPGATNVLTYTHEVITGETRLESISESGIAVPFTSGTSISGDGRYVAMSTASADLVRSGQPLDLNDVIDIYIGDRDMGGIQRVSVDRELLEGNGHSTAAKLDASGRFIEFSSETNNWSLDAGRYGQIPTLGNARLPLLVEISGFAEPTTISTIDLSTLNAVVGVPVTIPILVTGDSSAPLDGVASIDVATGEVCLQTSRTTVMGQANARRFDCEITFRSQGEHELSLAFSVSQTHESSALLAPITVVRPMDDPNQPPVAESQTLTVVPDTPRMINLVASDPDGDPLTYSLVSPTSNGSLSGMPPNITYTPDFGFTGEDSFVFGVNDGLANSGPATITLLISDTPVPVADSQTVTLDEDADAMITATGVASDGGALVYQLVSGPSAGTLMGTLPNVAYIPDANVFGVDSFRFLVTDSTGDSDPATVTLIVNPVNDPPSFTGGPDLVYPAGSSGTQTETAWATTISAGPMEMGTVSFTLVEDDNLDVVTDVSLTPDGTLEITLSGIKGIATVEVTAVDDEGAVSAPVTFEIRVGDGIPSADGIFKNGFEAAESR